MTSFSQIVRFLIANGSKLTPNSGIFLLVSLKTKINVKANSNWHFDSVFESRNLGLFKRRCAKSRAATLHNWCFEAAMLFFLRSASLTNEWRNLLLFHLKNIPKVRTKRRDVWFQLSIWFTLPAFSCHSIFFKFMAHLKGGHLLDAFISCNSILNIWTSSF